MGHSRGGSELGSRARFDAYDAWKAAFVATTVALGDSLEQALAAIEFSAPGAALAPERDPGLDAIVLGLRAPARGVRAKILAEGIREIMIAIDEVTLR